MAAVFPHGSGYTLNFEVWWYQESNVALVEWTQPRENVRVGYDTRWNRLAGSYNSKYRLVRRHNIGTWQYHYSDNTNVVSQLALTFFKHAYKISEDRQGLKVKELA